MRTKSLWEDRTHPEHFTLDVMGKSQGTDLDCMLLACNDGHSDHLLYNSECDSVTEANIALYVRKALSALRVESPKMLEADDSRQIVVVVLMAKDAHGAASYDGVHARHVQLPQARFEEREEARGRFPTPQAWTHKEGIEPRTDADVGFPSLTPRQRQVLRMILDGHPNKNIAADLQISMRTVENHRASIMRKTHSKSLPALVRFAIAAGEMGGPAPVARQ